MSGDRANTDPELDADTAGYADTAGDADTVDGQDASEIKSNLSATVSDVTGSRSGSTVYTNTTGSPLFVSVYAAPGGGTTLTGKFFVDGSQRSTIVTDNAGTVEAIVPDGSTYEAQFDVSIDTWSETELLVA